MKSVFFKQKKGYSRQDTLCLMTLNIQTIKIITLGFLRQDTLCVVTLNIQTVKTITRSYNSRRLFTGKCLLLVVVVAMKLLAIIKLAHS